jgi:PST family polysaccharide transporter/lipopolysaccharide exporter
VLSFTIEAAVRCLLSYLVCPYRPGLSFDRDHWRALFKYVRGVAGLPILTHIFMRTDIFVIGKLCSPAELGLYSMAAAISQIPFHFFGAIIAPIAMPTFSAMQTDKAWINEAILNITAAIAFVGFPLLLCAALYGKDLLLLVYGAEYTKVAGPFAIIFGSSLLQILCIPIATLYMAIGRPELHRLFAVIRTVSMLLLIYPAVKYFGLTGAAMAGLISIVLGFLFQLVRMHKITRIDLRRYGLIFSHALGISGVVAALWLITPNLYPGRPWLNLLPGAMGCLLAYALAMMAFLQSKGSFSTLFTASQGKQA